MKELSRKVGDMDYDGLITDMTPPVQVAGGIVSKLAAAATYARGTVFAKSTASGKLYILGTAPEAEDTLTPDCILCDDEDIGTAEDVDTVIYTGGCFDPGKVIVKDGYTMTTADKDKLRERGIVFKAASN